MVWPTRSTVTPPAGTSASTGSPIVGPNHQTARPATSARQAVSGIHARRSAGAQGQATSCGSARAGHDRDAHARGNRVGFERFLVAQPKQSARAAFNAAQAFAQRARAVLEFRRQFFIRLADAFQEIGLVREETPRMVTASHEDLALGDADGPRDERSLRVVFGKLAQENERDLLEQVR